jgi:glycosyltransferase involved in cell wall biosynthesis
MIKEKINTVLIFTSVHPLHDARIIKQVNSLHQAGYVCTLVAPWAGYERGYPFKERYFKRKGGIWGRFLAQLIFLRTALFSKWMFIHFHDFDTVPSAILLRLMSWRRVIYDVHENYGEEVMVREYIPMPLRHPLRWIVNSIEWLGVFIIGRVVVVVPVQVQRFRRWGCRKITLVRNYASTDMAPPDPVDPIKVQQDGYVISTSGQTVNYGALLILDAAAILAKSEFPVSIRGIDRFEGSASLKDLIFDRIIKEDVNNYKLLPRVPPQAIGSYLGSSAIGLSIRLDTPNMRQGIPTKLFEYMAYGIPIITTDVGYQADIVNESKAGVVIPADSAKALADAILCLWQDPELRARLGNAGREAFFRHYCWEAEAIKLVDFYMDC